MAISGLRWSSTDSQSTPHKCLSIQNSEIIEITASELTALIKACLLLSLFIEEETSLDDHIVADLDCHMTLSRTRGGPDAGRFRPRHHFQVQHVKVVEKVDSVPTPEQE
jgi:hypothetical protein